MGCENSRIGDGVRRGGPGGTGAAVALSRAASAVAAVHVSLLPAAVGVVA